MASCHASRVSAMGSPVLSSESQHLKKDVKNSRNNLKEINNQITKFPLIWLIKCLV